MNEKEKAKELILKYYNAMNPNAPDCNISFNQAKQCALIAVDEIMENERQNHSVITPVFDYWLEVKTEIEKL